jgi:hypothetical protein
MPIRLAPRLAPTMGTLPIVNTPTLTMAPFATNSATSTGADMLGNSRNDTRPQRLPKDETKRARALRISEFAKNNGISRGAARHYLEYLDADDATTTPAKSQSNRGRL